MNVESDSLPNPWGVHPYPDRLPSSPGETYVDSEMCSPEPPCKPTPSQKPVPMGSPVVPTTVVPSPESAVPSPVISADGTVRRQPVVSPASERDVADGNVPALEETDQEGIPDFLDQNAPKPKKGTHTISNDAIRQRANRIFTPRSDGTLKVSKKIFDEWKGKGKARKTLEDIFRQCGYDADPSFEFQIGLFSCLFYVLFFGSIGFETIVQQHKSAY